MSHVSPLNTTKADLGFDLFVTSEDLLKEIKLRSAKYGYWLSEYTPFTSGPCDCCSGPHVNISQNFNPPPSNSSPN